VGGVPNLILQKKKQVGLLLNNIIMSLFCLRRRGHRAHTQSQAQPSSQSAAILNRGVALISSGTVF